MSKDKLDEIHEKYITFLERDPSVIVGEMGIRGVVKEYGLGPFSQYLGITEISPLDNYRIRCVLKTGETKIYDFTPHLEKPMFQHLKDKVKFDDVSIDEFGVPVWMNADGITRDTNIGISWILENGVNEEI